MPVLTQSVVVTLVLFIAGLVYHAGRMSARLDNLERAIERQGASVERQLGELSALVRSAIGERRRHVDDPS